MIVSVIIPVYNDSVRLATCLEALARQSLGLHSFEVIVVDNNSQEDISVVVNSMNLPNFRYTKESAVGSYAARNKGLALATGSIIAFTDSDCIPQIDWLKEGVACLKRSLNPGVVGGKIELLFQGTIPNNVEIYEKYTAFRQIENISTGTCVGANWFSYKSVLVEFGYFNAALKSGGDTELSGRISRKGYKAYYCEKALILHPSRNSYRAIATKYARIFGGRFDKHKGNRWKFVTLYVIRFMFRRLKWNLKLVFKVSAKHSFAILVVNFYIFGRLIKESIKLATGKESERN